MFGRHRWRAPRPLVLRRGASPSRQNERGASLVEYALLLALIAVVAIGALLFLGRTVNNTLNSVAASVGSSGGGSSGSGSTTTTTTASNNPTWSSGTTDPVSSTNTNGLGQGVVSVAATSGVTPITYSLGTGAPNNVCMQSNTSQVTCAATNTTGNILVWDGNTTVATFTVKATNSADPGGVTETINFAFFANNPTGTLTPSHGYPGADDCTVSGTSPNYVVACSNTGFITGPGYYIDNAGTWTAVTSSNAIAEIEYGLDSGGWKDTTTGGYVATFTIPTTLGSVGVLES